MSHSSLAALNGTNKNGQDLRSRELEAQSRDPKADSRSLSPIFRDVHNLVLEDEQIGCALAGQANHVLVVILDPPVDNLAIHQLDRDWFLLFSKQLEESRFLESILGRRRPAALGGIGIPLWSAERHARIVHKLTGRTAHPT